MSGFELLKSEPFFQGHVFKIRRDVLKTPDGREAQYEIVEHNGSVIILPLDEEGNLLFVRQYRHAAGQDLLELPAGTREKDEPYHDCAAREIREEIGMAAGKLEHLGDFYLAPGYSTEFMAVFLATGLHDDPLEGDADEFLQLEKIPVSRAIERARRGELPDAKTLAALFLAEPFLNA